MNNAYNEEVSAPDALKQNLNIQNQVQGKNK